MRRLIIALIGCFLMASLNAIAQKTVSGRVTDGTSGVGLPGVTVAVKGSRTTTTTDVDGNYSISVPSDGSVLVFTYVGFEPREISARSANFNIALNPAVASIDEVVVTGYRTAIKKDFVGSAGTVKGAEVAAVPIASFDQAIQGRTPGLLLRAQSGQPGAAGSILIRGRASFGAGTEPLFIVDGLRIAGADFSQINPNDILNITVLKDAVATSIYGSQGANGVIVVTTKRGSSGRPKLEIDAYTGWGRFPTFNGYRLMNTSEKIEYELRRGGTSLEDYTQAELDSLRRINTDWEKETTRTGKTYSVNASASGGSDKTRYFASVNYFTQEGSVRNTSFDRITGRMNLTQDAGNFSFGLNTTGTLSNFTNTSETNTSIGAPLNAGIWTNPYEQPFVFGRYNAAGNFIPGGTVLTRPRIAESFQPIPTTDLFWNNNKSQDMRVIAGINAEYRIPMVKGLSLKTQYGIDYRQFNSNAFVDRRTYTGGFNPRPTSGASQNFRTSSFARDFFQSSRATWTSSLNYNKTIGDHSLDLGAFYETIDAKVNSNGRTVFLLESPFQNEAGATISADLIPRIRASGSESSIESVFGLLNYSYKGKYFVSGNVRRDGSSRFGANNRFATFGGIGLGWIMSEENFLQDASWLNLLKLRLSYGTVANDGALGPYTWQGTVGNRLYNASQGSIVSVPANPDLRWEGRTKFNLGFDFAMFNNRLTGGVDYYNEKTNDLILPNELSRTTGFTSILQNVGQIKNEGVEFNMSYDIVRTRSLRVNVNGNITYNDNKITKLTTQDTIVSGIIARIVGKPVNSIFLVEYGGVNPATGAAIYKKLDGTTTESINKLDLERRVVGMGDPNLFGGFGFDINYKGLALNTQFNYQFGSRAFNNERNNIENPDYYYDNMNVDLLNKEWQRPGDITNIPNPKNPFFANTTRFLEDNSFVRLRNIMLSYTLPTAVSSKLKLASVTFYAGGTNLLTWTNWRGRDPEFSQSGVLTGAQYPALRTTQLGLRVGF